MKRFSDKIRFVCCASQEVQDIEHIRSYDMPGDLEIERASILEAARATSAATTFFDLVQIGDVKFVDGALGANNPVGEVENEATNIWCSDGDELKPLVKCFVSVGTGNPGTQPMEDNGIKFLSKTLPKLVTETERTAENFERKWRRHFKTNRYFRFNVDQGLQHIQLADYKEKGPIQAATRAYLSSQRVKFRTQGCVDNLRLKQGMCI